MVKDYIKYNKLSESNYEIVFENGAKLGDLQRDVDGYFYWWPVNPSNGGCLQSWILRNLADKMDELNRGWDKTINNMEVKVVPEDYF